MVGAITGLPFTCVDTRVTTSESSGEPNRRARAPEAPSSESMTT